MSRIGETIPFVENKTDAKALIGTDLPAQSELGREMLDYLATIMRRPDSSRRLPSAEYSSCSVRRFFAAGV
jgi:hypothetical protein